MSEQPSNAELLQEAFPENGKHDLPSEEVQELQEIIQSPETNIGENKENFLNQHAGTHKLDEINDDLIIVDADRLVDPFPAVIEYTSSTDHSIAVAIPDRETLRGFIDYLELAYNSLPPV